MKEPIERIEPRLLFAAVSGTAYNDVNLNGAFDIDEPAIPGTVVYIDENGNDAFDDAERSALTDVSGAYAITGLLPGSYTLRLTLPNGALQSSEVLASLAADEARSNVNVAARDVRGSISGVVYQDGNFSGSRDDSEAASPGSVVFLDANNSGAYDDGESFLITDASGGYRFDGLMPGNYSVRLYFFEEGLVQTNDTSHVVLGPSQNLTGADLGFAAADTRPDPTATVSGVVFDDANQNGVKDANESTLATRTVFLDTNDNGLLDSDEATAQTGTGGEYSFAGLVAGTYNLRVIKPAGVTQTTLTGSVALAMGEVATNRDLGLYEAPPLPPPPPPPAGTTGNLTGRVFFDANKNGVFDKREDHIPFAKVFLDANGNGKLDRGERSTKASRNGVYTFKSVGVGTYTVSVALPGVFKKVFATTTAVAAVTGGATTEVSPLSLTLAKKIGKHSSPGKIFR